ncbi:GNAT family N-acetyltransferase [Sunxiuqinia elliptica]|jgi:GNAT superfamily N-acetyltransferase|uniref:Acetyltransferase (GNAT) family protein n=1 Tax=Sunxiuqinia elliptica TaxID=655355 RepID=A0A4R6H8V0_9BACT|nr:GNAT family N-acetyltransferase [Sunxiuqinia elliptica]TDO04863.1 acetyltransferase (GNAT) family protein [Sunxiuqinia elliptica]TDO64411.1 acetyltransferase (GNAT) family protein [Sunxiuqinia elliptica]
MSDIVIKQIEKRDFNSARKFAIEGMHLSRYASTKFELYFYSKYFWYLEISRATKALAAYMDDTLIGVILADMNGEKKIFKSWWYKLWIKVVSFIIKLSYKESHDAYTIANSEMLDNFKKQNTPDGEICFFAVDPEIKGKGIGTLLLNELAEQEKDKLVYLFTDTGSTYQFYLHRGFTKEAEKDIEMGIGKETVPLTCYLFSKRL